MGHVKSETEFHEIFQRLVDKAGGVRALARKLGVSAAYVSDVRLGRRSPGPSILTPMKLKRVVITRVEFHDVSGKRSARIHAMDIHAMDTSAVTAGRARGAGPTDARGA